MPRQMKKNCGMSCERWYDLWFVLLESVINKCPVCHKIRSLISMIWIKTLFSLLFFSSNKIFFFLSSNCLILKFYFYFKFYIFKWRCVLILHTHTHIYIEREQIILDTSLTDYSWHYFSNLIKSYFLINVCY